MCDKFFIPHRLVRVWSRLCLPVLIGLLTSVGIAAAQSTCTAQELLAIARAGAACAIMEVGEACYGSGSLSFTPTSGITTDGLTQPGDHVPLRELASVSVAPASGAEDAPISMATLVIRTSPDATDTLTVILIHDAEIQSDVIPPVEMLTRATGALPVRTIPDEDGELITELGVNNGVIANGRNGDWIRVIVPETGATGWVSAALISTEGNLGNLPLATPSDEVAQPFQTVHFNNSDSTACGNTLPAGALLQTPSTDLVDAVAISVNDAALNLAGTAFLIERDDALTLIMLDGIARIQAGSEEQFVPAGAQITAAMNADGNVTELLSNAVPYDEALITVLPINNLTRRFQVVLPQTQEAIDAIIAEITMPTPTPIMPIPTAIDACQRNMARDTTVWAGPGEDFEVLTELEAGDSITPVLGTLDPVGALWWQLENSGWVERSAVSERGNCTGLGVPIVVQVPPPPTNIYSLERCESFNGPVRVGQRVTFEFIPPAWDNYGEALAAIRTDPGTITINFDRYRAHASDPFPLGTNVDPLEDRYLRRFTLTWVAQPGAYRVTGDWHTYEPNCDLTVPVE